MDKIKKSLIIIVSLTVIIASILVLMKVFGVFEKPKPELTEREKILLGWIADFTGQVEQIDREKNSFRIYFSYQEEEENYLIVVTRETSFFTLEFEKVVAEDREVFWEEKETPLSFNDLEEGMVVEVIFPEKMDPSRHSQFPAKRVNIIID